MLIATLNKKQLPEFPSEIADDSYPLFVTWNKDGNLRGCIGTFRADNLSKNLPDFTMSSALRDHWFEPIKLSEISKLEVCISLLLNFEKIEDPLDWEVGTHGIEIEFTKDERTYWATYLPNVASE